MDYYFFLDPIMSNNNCSNIIKKIKLQYIQNIIFKKFSVKKKEDIDPSFQMVPKYKQQYI